MSSPNVAATIARVEQCALPVENWDALGVWHLTRELGIRMTPIDDKQLHVAGDRTAALFLATAIRRHKAALLRGACVRCRHHLAETDDRLCGWCVSVRGRVYVYAPNGVAERSYLERRASQGML